MADDDDSKAGELTTVNYGWTKPNVMGSDDQWGGYLNSDLDGIDTTVKSVSTVANAAYPASNPAGYITAAAIPAPYVLPTASTSVLGGVKVDGSTITISGGTISGASASITIGDTAPVSPKAGALWYDSVGGQLYVFYADPNTSQWVIANNQQGAQGPQGPPGVAGPNTLPQGVTNGTDAAAGQIGEVISSVVASPGVTLTSNATSNVASLALTAGDWDVCGTGWIAVGTGGATGINCGIGSTSGLMTSNAVGQSRTTLSLTFPASLGQFLALTPCRVSLAAPASVYLVASATFPSGTTTAYGNIWARRAR